METNRSFAVLRMTANRSPVILSGRLETRRFPSPPACGPDRGFSIQGIENRAVRRICTKGTGRRRACGKEFLPASATHFNSTLHSPHSALPIVSPSMSSVGMSTGSQGSVGWRMRLMRRLAASRPMAALSWRTVVSRGRTTWMERTPSYPAREMSSGTRSPFSRSSGPGAHRP